METHCRSITFFIYVLISAILITSNQAEGLTYCLTSNGVHNYTTFSTTDNSDLYDHLLYTMMQNPIFKRPTFRRPSAIVLPESKEQLARTIVCCRRGSWTIRIRSGGHSYEGWSHTAESPFVLIDLMNLNHIEIDLDHQTAWVESGATLGQIYHAIGEKTDSLGFSAGYCPTVGSGGHISGGGFGMMSRKYGLAADNVIDALLIDANGNILDRNSMGEDVFWAIRGGGGGSWGAIYSWKIQLLPVPKKVTTFRLMKSGLKMEEASELLYKFQFVAPELEDHFSITLLAAADQNGIWVQFLGLYLGPKVEALSTIDRVFPELHIADEYLEVGWVESLALIAGLKSVADLNDRFLKWEDRAFKTKVDFLKAQMPMEGVKCALEMLMKEPRGFIAVNGFNGVMSKIRSDALPFPHRNGTLMMFEVIVAWDMEEDWKSSEFVGWLREFHGNMGPFINSDQPRMGYVNHVDLDLGGIDWTNTSISSNAVEIARKWGEEYFSSNYNRLVRAKTLIDPNNVFHNPQSIPPLPGIDLKESWEMEAL